MFRLYIPFALALVFIGWVLFRLLIKKDLKQNLNSVYLGLFFMSIWAIMYTFIFK